MKKENSNSEILKGVKSLLVEQKTDILDKVEKKIVDQKVDILEKIDKRFDNFAIMINASFERITTKEQLQTLQDWTERKFSSAEKTSRTLSIS